MIRKITACLLILLIQQCFNPNFLFGQSLTVQIDSVVSEHIRSGIIPGAVVHIKKSGKVVHSRAYGYAQLTKGRGESLVVPIKMTTAHLFDIASLTKVIGTTTALMILVDRDSIKLDEPVSNYLPGFEDPPKSQITIRHLLQHTAGLYEWYPMYYKASGKESIYDLIHQLPLPYPVGAKRRYSDLGFTLLGEIVERVGKQPLDVFMKKNIFYPLGMHHTMYRPIDERSGLKIAATSTGNPYEKRMVYDPSLGFQFSEIQPGSWNLWRDYVLVGEVNDGNAWYGGKGVSGAAGLFSTASDLQKLVDMLLHGGKHGSQQFLSEKVVRTFLTVDGYGNGLGWVMDPESSFMQRVPEGSFGHTGFTGTSIVAIPSKKLSVIILTNRQHVGFRDGKNYTNVNPLRQAILEKCLALYRD